ncbi:MAG: flavodoxin family protein [Clostridia bacterium]|nr:flavodoxin family protein [Clostridia bacterium]
MQFLISAGTETGISNILILNGSPRKNGKTASLVNAFKAGAEASCNEVTELYLQGMKIGGCLAREGCRRTGNGCVQKDEMGIVYDAFSWCDAAVFASPQYWGTITGQLKIVIDRLYAALFGHPAQKKFVVIMTARGGMYDMAMDFFSIFTRFLAWENIGNVPGAGKEEEAKALGASV